MRRLKRIKDQVIVITGASSGIGLVTARMAGKRGAKLVLVARAEPALQTLTEELNAAGTDAIYAPNLTDKVMERRMVDAQQKGEAEKHSYEQHNALYYPSGELQENGDYDGHVAKSSLYTKARLHPRIAAGSLAFLATALGYALLRRTPSTETVLEKGQ